MKCKHCGEEIANDSIFCENCGKRIKKMINWTWVVIAASLTIGIIGVIPCFNYHFGYKSMWEIYYYLQHIDYNGICGTVLIVFSFVMMVIVISRKTNPENGKNEM